MRTSRTVPATPPNESGWSFPTLLNVFAASLPIWMRKFGVRAVEVQDATQEALFEAWQGLAEMPAAHDKAQQRMLRIAAKIAQRLRRRAARLVCMDELEAPDLRDFETWIATRMLWLQALQRLDEPARKLLVAYKIEERTYEQIGADLGEKTRRVRQRVDVAEEKLQAELDKLTGNDKKGKRRAAAMGVGCALDPFDRAVFRAILDVEEEFGLAPPPASTVRPIVTAKPWPWQYFPLGILALALFMVPGQGWRTEALYAEKIRTIPLQTVKIRAAMPEPGMRESDAPERLPKKISLPPRATAPALRSEDHAVVKNLSERGLLGTPH